MLMPSPTLEKQLLPEASLQSVARICERHGIIWLAVFGSVGKGEARADSDVDVLIEFDSAIQVSYFDLESIAEELSPLFGNRYVDIGQPKQLHWYIRDRILAEARVLYARRPSPSH